MFRSKKLKGLMALLPLLAFSFFCVVTSFHFHSESTAPSASSQCQTCQLISQASSDLPLPKQQLIAPGLFEQLTAEVFHSETALFILSANSRAPPFVI